MELAIELCTETGSEKMEACDEEADDAMDGSYGPHPFTLW